MLIERQDPLPDEDEFDYTHLDKVFNNFINYAIENENTEPSLDMMRAFLDLEAMQAFFAWYLTQDDFFEAQFHNEETLLYQLPRSIDEFSAADFFGTAADKTVSIRQQGVLPFTHPESEWADDVIAKNPRIHRATLVFHDFVGLYLNALENFAEYDFAADSLNNEFGETLEEDIANTLNALDSGFESNPIKAEFLKLIALGLSKDGNITVHSLRRAYQKPSSFESVSIPEEGEEAVINICPFKETIGRLFNTGYLSTNNGQYIASERPSWGALFQAIDQKFTDLGLQKSHALRHDVA